MVLVTSVQTKWGLFSRGCSVKFVAAHGNDALVDFGIERPMHAAVDARVLGHSVRSAA